MNFKYIIPVFALLGGLLLFTTALAADAEAYESALSDAQKTISDAESRAQLWTTIDSLLEDAEKAAAAGDFDKAVEMVNEAALHAELAVATAEREKNTWQKGVPK